jgi:hypothetical protein
MLCRGRGRLEGTIYSEKLRIELYSTAEGARGVDQGSMNSATEYIEMFGDGGC